MSGVHQDELGGVFDDEQGTVIRSYAEALVNAATKGHEVEEVIGELEEILEDLVVPYPQFAAMLSSSSVTIAEKERVLSQTLEGHARLTVLRFLKVLNNNGRLPMLAAVTHEARAQWDKKQNRRPVEVKTAVPLDDHQKSVLADKIAKMINATPILGYQVDPSLLGGVVIQVGDDLYDASIKTKLERMRRDLLAGRSRDLAGHTALID